MLGTHDTTSVPMDERTVDRVVDAVLGLVLSASDELRRSLVVVAFDGGIDELLSGAATARSLPAKPIAGASAVSAESVMPSFSMASSVPIAPEVDAGHPATEAAASFAIGVALYRLLTGCTPPADVDALSSAIDEVTLAGAPQLLWRTLAKEPSLRPPLAELAYRLELIAAERHPQENTRFGTLLVGVRSSIGRNSERIENEDALGSVAISLADPTVVGLCVADGMGGMEAGELASATAVRAWMHALSTDPDVSTPSAQSSSVVAAVRHANRAVLTALEGQRGGCTFTGVLMVGHRLALAHVGDSRAYLWPAAGGLVALSRDHSLVASLVAVGAISPEEAVGHPDRNKILRCLGLAEAEEEGYIDDLSSQEFDPAHLTRELACGDVVLLVSDGVWGEITDAEIAAVVDEHRRDPQRMVDDLVSRALVAGGHDNATAVAMTVDPPIPQRG